MGHLLILPKLTANDDEGEVAHWYVQDKGYVEKGADVVDIALSKAVYTLQADCAGFIRQHVGVNQTLKIGEVLASFHPDLASAEGERPPERAAKKGTSLSPLPRVSPLQGEEGGKASENASASRFPFTRFSPEASRWIAEQGLDPAQFDGLGLVTRPVAEQYARAHFVSTPASGVERSEGIPRSKVAEIEALTEGQSGGVNSLLSVEFFTDGLMATLKRYNLLGGQILPIILHELAKTLRKYPKLNAYYADGKIHYYGAVNIGVAIDLGEGLRVAVVRDTEKLLPSDFQLALIDLTRRYATQELREPDLTGATVTVTDLSYSNIRFFHPLLNRKQSIILGVGGDKTLPGAPMSLNVTFDHRVTSGREVASFLGELKKGIIDYCLEPS